jgi:hypothetical protein
MREKLKKCQVICPLLYLFVFRFSYLIWKRHIIGPVYFSLYHHLHRVRVVYNDL